MKKKYIVPASRLIMVSPELCQEQLSGSAYTSEQGRDGMEARDERDDKWIGGSVDVRDPGFGNWEFGKPNTWFEED